MFFAFSCLVCRAQIFIGKDKDAVKQLMKEKREFAFDESSVNTVYNTMKFVDSNGSRTFLFLFDDNDICTLSKLMCDYSFLDKTTKQLDEDYTAGENGQWIYTEDGINYIITLKKGDWFFSVSTKKAE